MLYLSVLVLMPLAALLFKAVGVGWTEFWQVLAAPRTAAAFRLTFGASLAAALVNAAGGFLLAWVLVRYRFPLKRLLDALIDLPFALPTAVAGIALTTVYAKNGWIGSWLAKAGISAAYTPLGVVIALIFVGLPFVVRTVQPVLADLEPEIEEAAVCMGASRRQVFWRVLLPGLWPSVLTGFGMAFARGLGEYGSVIFISGNMPMRTEIVPLLIMTKLDQFEYHGAAALAVGMLMASFAVMLAVNLLVHWASRRGPAGAAV